MKNLKDDLPAGLVVFLVALPLCLGIAHASGVPPLAGVVSGIIGGIIVGFLSGSHTSVSGPAAGLIVMVLTALEQFGYEGLLVVTMLAGLMQIAFGVLKLGWIQRLFPKTVIQGMLVAIGLILIIKQIPHVLGHIETEERGMFEQIPAAFADLNVGALIIAVISLGILVGAPKVAFIAQRKWLPAALLAVVGGVLINTLLLAIAPEMAVGGKLLVELPTEGLDSIRAELATPAFSMLLDEPAVWLSAVGIAIVASVETLLCTEAVDGIDPHRRRTDANRELLAQGAGNAIAGCLGGIPITAVIVRGSANVAAGARTKTAAIAHGAMLLVSVFALAVVLNTIPLAALAALLVLIGFRLAHPNKIMAILKRSPSHWVPFVTTVSVILLVDLLKGIFLGLAVSAVFVIAGALRARAKAKLGEAVTLQIGPVVPWLSKTMVGSVVSQATQGELTIDASDSDPLDEALRESLTKMRESAAKRGVVVALRGHESDQSGKDGDANGVPDDEEHPEVPPEENAKVA